METGCFAQIHLCKTGGALFLRRTWLVALALSGRAIIGVLWFACFDASKFFFHWCASGFGCCSLCIEFFCTFKFITKGFCCGFTCRFGTGLLMASFACKFSRGRFAGCFSLLASIRIVAAASIARIGLLIWNQCRGAITNQMWFAHGAQCFANNWPVGWIVIAQ